MCKQFYKGLYIDEEKAVGYSYGKVSLLIGQHMNLSVHSCNQIKNPFIVDKEFIEELQCY